jgi:hypothetical protein
MSREIYDVNDKGVVDTVQAFSWANIAAIPSCFPPCAHTHQISDVIGLSTALATFITVASLPTALSSLYYTQAQTNALLATKANIIHFHDDIYYRKSYIDATYSPSGIDNALYVYEQSTPLQHNHDNLYYQKPYIDNLLNSSNFSLVNDARYYTKPEVDSAIANAPYLTQADALGQFYTQDQINGFLAVLGDGLFVFTPTSPSTEWDINHGLGRYPTVNVVVSGELSLARVLYPDADHVTIQFSFPESGKAYLT